MPPIYLKKKSKSYNAKLHLGCKELSCAWRKSMTVMLTVRSMTVDLSTDALAYELSLAKVM